MKRGPKPLGRLLIPKILQVLEEANCDLRAWTITVRLGQLAGRPSLKWDTVHKYLEQMVREQMIFMISPAHTIWLGRGHNWSAREHYGCYWRFECLDCLMPPLRYRGVVDRAQQRECTGSVLHLERSNQENLFGFSLVSKQTKVHQR